MVFFVFLLALEDSDRENLQKGDTWLSTKNVVSNTLLLYLQNSPTKNHLTNPCYPRDYSINFTMGHVFDSLCTVDQRPESYNPSDIITFEGTGDPSLCKEKVASLFDFKACHDQETCSFDGVYQPKIKGPFVVRAKPERFLSFPVEYLFLTFLFLLC